MRLIPSDEDIYESANNTRKRFLIHTRQIYLVSQRASYNIRPTLTRVRACARACPGWPLITYVATALRVRRRIRLVNLRNA